MVKLNLMQNSDKEHEKDHYYEVLSNVFFRLGDEFKSSSKNFSEIINHRHKVIVKMIPTELKLLLRDLVEAFIEQMFRENYFRR